jgi:hypothetical protein
LGKRQECVQETEVIMRGLGALLVTGVAAVMVWKLLAVFFFGLMGMALKVGLVVLVVWLVLKLLNGNGNGNED